MGGRERRMKKMGNEDKGGWGKCGKGVGKPSEKRNERKKVREKDDTEEGGVHSSRP